MSESKNRKPFMSVWMAGQRLLSVMCRRTSLHSQEQCFFFLFSAHREQSTRSKADDCTVVLGVGPWWVAPLALV